MDDEVAGPALGVWLYPREKRHVKSFYSFGEVIGTGSFSKVKWCRHLETEEARAVKIFDKSALDTIDLMYIKQEIEIMKMVDHPNVIKLYDVFESDEKLYLVTDLVEGGELFDRIQDVKTYTEKDASRWIGEIVRAIQFLHERGIVHRDLKPENLLITSVKDDGEVKVADFGLAKVKIKNDLLLTACGTPEYAAPEILEDCGYTEAVDMWSIGVIMYLIGYLPFEHDDTATLFEMIKDGTFDVPDHVSEPAADLLKKVLVTDPNHRYTTQQTLKHPWIVGEGDLAKAMLQHKLDNSESISDFNEKRQQKSAAMVAMVAAHLMDRDAKGGKSHGGSRERLILDKELMKPNNRKSLELLVSPALFQAGNRLSFQQNLLTPANRNSLAAAFCKPGNRGSMPLHMLKNFDELMAEEKQRMQSEKGKK